MLERAQGPTLLDCNYADTCFTVALGSVLAGCYTQVPHRSTLYRHGPPLFAPPSTSARAQSRFEFVEIGRGMFFNYQGEVQAITRIIGCSHLVPRAIYESTVYMYENIEYVQVPEDPLCNTYGYMNAYVPFVTYVWRTWENICIYLVAMILYAFLHLLRFTEFTRDIFVLH